MFRNAQRPFRSTAGNVMNRLMIEWSVAANNLFWMMMMMINQPIHLMNTFDGGGRKECRGVLPIIDGSYGAGDLLSRIN